MSTLLSFLAALNTLSPLAVIALLGLVLWRMAGHATVARAAVETRTAVEHIRTNDLHELPTIVLTLKAVEGALSNQADTLRRIELRLLELVALAASCKN